MNFMIAILIGLLAGIHTSTWGMYKDSPHEGFTYPKYFRSTIIGGIWAFIIWLISGLELSQTYNWLILFGATYGMERITLEFYKTFLREEDQSKYFIPMQFGVKGNVVESRSKRLTVGAAYIMGIMLVGLGIYSLQKVSFGIPSLLLVFIIGSAGGWISAFGGAWKDAPLEGFQIFKFFRSPAIAFFYAILISFFTTNYLFITLCAIGYTVATIETYKTFFFPNKPRGKFAGKPIDYPDMLRRRQRFVPLYVAIWLGIILTFVVSFTQTHNGLM